MLDSSTEAKVRQELEDILTSGEFGGDSKSSSLIKTIADMIKAVGDWISDRLGTIGSGIGVPHAPEAGGGVLFLKAAGILILCVFIFVIAFFLIRNLRRSRVAVEEFGDVFEVLREPELFEQKADENADMGNFRESLRFLYIALLLRLNDAGIVKIDKSKTNRQYLREIRTSGIKHYTDFAAFTDAFNVHWYGRKSLNPDEFYVWQRNYTLLAKECVR